MSEVQKEFLETLQKRQQEQIKLQSSIANFSNKCWAKCVLTPTSSASTLTPEEITCAKNCVLRYYDVLGAAANLLHAKGVRL
jgi:hypothetical protein